MPSQSTLCGVVRPILRWGMVLSLILMLIGLALGVIAGEQEATVVPLEKIPLQLMEMDPAAFLTLGIVLLIATPLARVFGALCVFIRERDRKFILVSMAVLLSVFLAVILGAA
ncbi:MAG TPA: DUF1634 domain-containing protein [Methanomassiliicoccales archaeon]|nr:DUF1634 domain-containing protein [Methanomassiliicoccales archaeon]